MAAFAHNTRRAVRAALGKVKQTLRPDPTDRQLAVRLRHPVRWGSLRSFTPVSRQWGSDRGTSVDRFFFDRFLKAHAAAIRGRVMEIRDDTCSRTYGGDAVTSTLIVDVDAGNDRAHLLADLCVPGSLGDERVDSIILTQTIGVLLDYPVALRNLWAALRPGGAMLITNNVLGRVTPASDGPDLIRHTPHGLRRTIERVLPDANVEEFAFGNLITSTALLHGIAAEELTTEELDRDDPMFPTSCAAIVRRSATST